MCSMAFGFRGASVGVNRYHNFPTPTPPSRPWRDICSWVAHNGSALRGSRNAVGGTCSAWIVGYPFVSPFQCWVRSDTSSSTCTFIIPPALQPKANIEMGIQGVRLEQFYAEHVPPRGPPQAEGAETECPPGHTCEGTLPTA